MKADLDDAPEWISRRRKRSGARMLIPGLIGTCITFGALYFGSQAFLQGTVQHIVEKRQQPQQPQRVPVAEITRSEPSVNNDWDKVVDEASRLSRGTVQTGAAEAPAQTTKQTVFNDNNYTPRGADNVVNFIESAHMVEEKKTAEKMKVTIIKQEPSMKDSACWPHKGGSIEFRKCKLRVGLNSRG